MRQLMRMIGIGGLIAVMMTIGAAPAAACSGGVTPFLLESLPGYDVIVRATIMDVDDTGHTAVLYVYEYLKGSGSRYLVLQRWVPGALVRYQAPPDGLGCPDGPGASLPEGVTGYFVLDARSDGTFTDNGSTYSEPGHFIFEGEGIVVQTASIGNELYQSEYLTEAELRQRFLDAGDRAEPFVPPLDIRQPLLRHLHLTTENGTRYRVNPDRSVIQLDPYLDPLVISPNGIVVVFRVDDETIGAQAVSTRRQVEENAGDIQTFLSIPGRGIVFSPDSTAAAIFTGETISIVRFNLEFIPETGGRYLLMYTSASAPIALDATMTAPRIVWSENSSTVSFQDARGVWVWNLFTEGAPTLTVDAETLAGGALFDLSASGSFVRYGHPREWFLLEWATGTIRRNVVMTPDERNLIIFDIPGTAPPTPTPQGTLPWRESLDPASIAIPRTCPPPVRTSCPIYVFARDLVFWTWYRRDQIVACLGSDRSEQHCTFNIVRWQQFSTEASNYPYGWDSALRQIAYDPQFNRIAGIAGDYLLDLTVIRAERLDLTGVIDSPIASVEWGQPIFYVDETG